MEQVIDASVGHGHRRSCSPSARSRPTHMQPRRTSRELRALMDEARARRLQPHYIEGAFRAAFTRLGGQDPPARAGPLRDHARPRRSCATAGTRPDRHPLRARHLRHRARARAGRAARAELLAPGHPLHDAVTDQTIAQLAPDARARHRPRLADGRGAAPARRRHRGDRRRDRDDRRPALRLRLRRRDGTVEAAGPGAVPRLRRGAADRRRSSRPAQLPWLARRRGARRRAGSSPTSSPSTWPRSSAAARPSSQRVRDQVGSRLDQENEPARSSRRWSPGEGAGRQEAEGDARRA